MNGQEEEALFLKATSKQLQRKSRATVLRKASRAYFRLNRAAMVLSRIQGMMVLYLFCKSLGISFWLSLLGMVPIIYFVHYVDKHYILPEELDMIFDNPERKREKAS